MGSVCRAESEVDEKRLVRDERLLLPDPTDGLVGQIFRQVVTFFGCTLRLDRRRSVIQRRVILVVLSANEAVEMFEARTSRPVVERAHRARLKDRHFMAFPELRG